MEATQEGKAVKGSEQTAIDLSSLTQVRDTGKKQSTSDFIRESLTLAIPEWYFGRSDNEPGYNRFYTPDEDMIKGTGKPVTITYSRESGSNSTSEQAGKDSTAKLQGSLKHSRDTTAQENNSSHKADNTEDQDTKRKKLLSGFSIGVGIMVLLALIGFVATRVVKANNPLS
ncbi:hypothetical protein [Cnuella takakiae]|nr:hypothetical protein [Cnuella takakiae]OLY92302.1 hypothetical protein BUE76_10650 [Cnuella takakiae]